MKTNKETFKPISFWKSAILSMPDNSFFELLRSVFGKIKTPFSKQQLLNDLENFLLRDDIQKAIASYIDENDEKIITAIALFTEPTPLQLTNFFAGEFGYAQLQDIIVNLEERFIVYRFTEDKTNQHAGSRLTLNPVLMPVLKPYIKNASVLFPAVPAADASVNAPSENSQIIYSDLLLAGFLSFASQLELFYRADESSKTCVIRKRVIETGKACFPGINLNHLTNCLLVLGLFYIDKEKLVPDRKHLEDFSSLSARERSEYFAAAMLSGGESPPSEILPPLYRGRLREIDNLIHSFLDSLKADAQYPEKTLIKIIGIIKDQSNVSIDSGTLLTALIKTGLITNPQAGLYQLGAIPNHKPAKYDKPVIVIDSGSSILVYPEINFKDALDLASFSVICENGSSFMTSVFRFNVTKDSAVRSFNNNNSAKKIIELLNRLSFGKADDVLIWNLNDWEKRHKDVSLRKCVLLSLSEEHRYLTQTRSLASMIFETLAPGLYLLNENLIEDAANALNHAGIDIIGRNNPVNPQENKISFTNHFPSPLAIYSQLSIPISQLTSAENKTTNKPKEKDAQFASALASEFHAILKKMQLTDTERTELTARIDRRLVLCETQLKDADVRYEKLEAKLMDYTGKQNIAKQAISQQSPVEIICPDGEKIFGIPKALEKEGNGLILVIDTMAMPNQKNEANEIRRITLSKIILLRRIKKSIFEI